MSDWKPNVYLSFEKERTQPSVDLAARVAVDGVRRIIDIGCGPGNSTMVLRERWPEAEIIGLDRSEAMLEAARQRDAGIRWVGADVSGDLPDLGGFDLVFSNAALQWVRDQERAIPRLFEMVAKGGTLAVQVPFTLNMPLFVEKEKLIREPRWQGRFDAVERYSVFPLDYYYDIVSGLAGEATVWETHYCHVMGSYGDIVKWYTGSGLRPILDCLPDERERTVFLGEYQAALEKTTPGKRTGLSSFPSPVFSLPFGRGKRLIVASSLPISRTHQTVRRPGVLFR